MRIVAPMIFATAVYTATASFAQEPKDKSNRTVYEVEFNIRDGSPATSNPGGRYGMQVVNDGRGVFRLGSKVPYITGGTQSTAGAPLVNRQYNYADIGVNVECLLHELNGRISLHANIELSSVVRSDKGISPAEPNPTIASSRVEVTTDLDSAKPVVIATVDDPVTQRKLEIEATVTKLI